MKVSKVQDSLLKAFKKMKMVEIPLTQGIVRQLSCFIDMMRVNLSEKKENSILKFKQQYIYNYSINLQI